MGRRGLTGRRGGRAPRAKRRSESARRSARRGRAAATRSACTRRQVEVSTGPDERGVCVHGGARAAPHVAPQLVPRQVKAERHAALLVPRPPTCDGGPRQDDGQRRGEPPILDVVPEVIGGVVGTGGAQQALAPQPLPSIRLLHPTEADHSFLRVPSHASETPAEVQLVPARCAHRHPVGRVGFDHAALLAEGQVRGRELAERQRLQRHRIQAHDDGDLVGPCTRCLPATSKRGKTVSAHSGCECIMLAAYRLLAS